MCDKFLIRPLIFQLLLKPKFSAVEKIKTIGSTYMVAAGLHPGKEEVSWFEIFIIIIL